MSGDKQETRGTGFPLLLAAIENLERNLEQCRFQLAEIQKILRGKGLVGMEEIAVAEQGVGSAAAIGKGVEKRLRGLLDQEAGRPVRPNGQRRDRPARTSSAQRGQGQAGPHGRE